MLLEPKKSALFQRDLHNPVPVVVKGEGAYLIDGDQPLGGTRRPSPSNQRTTLAEESADEWRSYKVARPRAALHARHGGAAAAHPAGRPRCSGAR